MANYNITAIVRNKRGIPIGIGKNSYTRTHPLMRKAMEATGKKNYSFIHAEVAALLKVKDWSKAHSIEVYRFRKDGLPALAKPCLSCQWIIGQTGIKKVFHT